MEEKDLRRSPESLRQEAEKKLSAKTSEITLKIPANIDNLLYELEVHQAELEIQNEELRNVQLELRDSRDRYLNLYEYAPIGYFTLDKNSLIIEVNLTGAVMLGKPRGRLINSDFTHYIAPAAQDAFYLHLRQVLETSSRQNCELQIKKRDGTFIYVVVSSIARADADGKLTQCFSTITDVTVEKQSAALKESEKKYRSLIDSMQEGLWVRDSENITTFVNQYMADMLGYTTDEMLGKSLFAFIDEDNIEKARLHIKRKRQGFKEQYDLKLIKKDGTPISVLVEATPIIGDDGTYCGALACYTNITERARIGLALKQSERRFRQMFEEHQAIMLLIEPESGRIMDANQAAAAFYGYSREVLKTMKITEINQLQPDKTARELLKALNKEQNHFTFSHRLAGGEVRTVEVHSTPIDVDNLHVLFSIIHDITDRKKAEDKIIELNTSLLLHSSQVEAANKELESFSYSVSHDLRAPLRSIDGFSQAVIEDYSDKLDPKGLDYLQRIRTASQFMAQLIDDILDISRITRVEINLEKVDLSKLALGVTEELKEQQPDRRVEFNITTGLVAYGDSHLLKLVFDNLLGNAFKFTGKRPLAEISFGVAQFNGKPAYFVKDNGDGFDMAYANKLFKPFQRLHTTEEFPGTGIGLASVQNIIRRLGGKVWAESQKDKGATFFFTLPQI